MARPTHHNSPQDERFRRWTGRYFTVLWLVGFTALVGHAVSEVFHGRAPGVEYVEALRRK